MVKYNKESYSVNCKSTCDFLRRKMPRTKRKTQNEYVSKNLYKVASSLMEKQLTEKLADLAWKRKKSIAKIEMEFAHLRIKYESVLQISIKELQIIGTEKDAMADISDLLENSSLAMMDEDSSPKVIVSAKQNSSTGMKTPFKTRQQTALALGLVTPKVKPDQPMTVLRRAQDGEMVISMCGSPILVNISANDKPNVNVPLGHGRVLTVQPVNGIRLSEIPEIDEETRVNLIHLRNNIDRIVNK